MAAFQLRLDGGSGGRGPARLRRHGGDAQARRPRRGGDPSARPGPRPRVEAAHGGARPGLPADHRHARLGRLPSQGRPQPAAPAACRDHRPRPRPASSATGAWPMSDRVQGGAHDATHARQRPPPRHRRGALYRRPARAGRPAAHPARPLRPRRTRGSSGSTSTPVRAAQGVVCVLTAADVPGENDVSPTHRHDEPLLATDLVQFVGQPIFAVAATTRDQARRAASARRRSNTRSCRRSWTPRRRCRPASWSPTR